MGQGNVMGVTGKDGGSAAGERSEKRWHERQRYHENGKVAGAAGMRPCGTRERLLLLVGLGGGLLFGEKVAGLLRVGGGFVCCFCLRFRLLSGGGLGSTADFHRVVIGGLRLFFGRLGLNVNR